MVPPPPPNLLEAVQAYLDASTATLDRGLTEWSTIARASERSVGSEVDLAAAVARSPPSAMRAAAVDALDLRARLDAREAVDDGPDLELELEDAVNRLCFQEKVEVVEATRAR